jgi:dipeptidyl aminopeptidase/acylaminoacyl peptidase
MQSMRGWLLVGCLLAAIVLASSASPSQSDEPLDPLSIEGIVRLPAVTQFELAPDGRRAAVTVSITGQSGIAVIEGPDRESVPVASGEDRYGDPSWSPDGGEIAFTSDRTGRWQIFVAEPGKESARQLTGGETDDRRPRWSPDGRRIAFLSRQPVGNTGWDVSVIPAEGGKPVRLTRDPLDEEDPRWSPDGKSIAFTSRGGRYVNRRIAVVPAEGGEPRELLPQDWNGDSHSPRWSPDGREVAFVSDRDGQNAIFIVDAAGGAPRRLTGGENKPSEQTEPAWSPDGQEIAHVENEEGTMRLMVTAVAEGRSRSFTLAPGVYETPQWSSDGKTLAALFSGSVYSPDVWLYERAGGRTRLSNSLPLAIDVRKMARPELVHYASRDGRTISGYLYSPLAASPEKPVPLILHAHGASQWTNGWHPFVQFLAQQGFAVFVPNLRGSSGFGREFQDLNDGDWGGGDLEDLVAGVAAITARPEIRDSGVGIWGVGYGAFLTLAALGQHPDLFACGVEAMGMPDLESMYLETNAEGIAYLERELGPLRGHLELYRELSPIRFVESMKAPLLSFHSEDYPLVPYSTKVGWLKELYSREYPLEEFVFKEDQGEAVFHLDRFPNAALFYMEKILEFFELYL